MSLEIKSQWLASTKNADDEVSATLARVKILLSGKNITEYRQYRKSDSKLEDALQIPAYYLAEWLAENWWVVLFEPRKDEHMDDSDFTSRHSLVAAQHGFPLPALTIMPFGRSIRLNNAPRLSPYANVRFTQRAFADMARSDVERILASFVDQTIAQLRARGVVDTPLDVAWASYTALTPEEREFCELVGSLGISPSEVSGDLTTALDRIYEIFGGRATRDFCLAASSATVISSVHAAESLDGYMQSAEETTLEPVLSAELPAESYSLPAWRRGLRAADNLRRALNVSVSDPQGADKIFGRLGIDTTHAAPVDGDVRAMPFNGAVQREANRAKIALLQDHQLLRRFGGGRATYLAWVSEASSRRLVTNAVTRDQQASRAFAAEILVPQGYLKRLAGSKNELDDDQIREVARERRAMLDMVFKQASNVGITVRAI